MYFGQFAIDVIKKVFFTFLLLVLFLFCFFLIVAIIWRQISENTFKVVGMNIIEIQPDQTQRHFRHVVPKSNRIEVKAGDIIGWVSQFLPVSADKSGDKPIYRARGEVDIDNSEYSLEKHNARKYAIHATVEPIEGIFYSLTHVKLSHFL